mmetsp:Transcript_9481/g.18170  ORF Transcript_9481/g.18170 Transcript_9481/m.18170 type:complete len:426 (-) Transcript_9481:1406-2683(-)
MFKGKLCQELHASKRSHGKVHNFLAFGVRNGATGDEVYVVAFEFLLNVINIYSVGREIGNSAIKLVAIVNRFPRFDERRPFHGSVGREESFKVEISGKVKDLPRMHVLDCDLDLWGCRLSGGYRREHVGCNVELDKRSASAAFTYRRIHDNLLRSRRQTKRVLVQLYCHILYTRRRTNIDNFHDHANLFTHLLEASVHFETARLFGSTNLIHGAFGRTGSCSGTTTAASQGHTTNVEQIHSTASIIIFVVLFFLLVLIIVSASSASTSANNKGFGRLVINRRESGDLSNQDIEQRRIQFECIILNNGLVTQDNHLGGLGVGRQQTPVNETTVPQIGIVGFFRCQIQNTLDHVLRVLRILEKTLDRSREQLQLNRRVFLFERFQKGIEQLIGVINTFCVFSDNPNHTRLGKRFIEGIQIIAQSGND